LLDQLAFGRLRSGNSAESRRVLRLEVIDSTDPSLDRGNQTSDCAVQVALSTVNQ
jgi:hypothetical protein